MDAPRRLQVGSTAERRARLVTRHRLGGDAADPVAATAAMVVLHATDPATVYLSVLARCAEATLADVAQALYDDRTLVRMLAMRRTLFVAPRPFAPVVHHAASLDVAATIRRRLVTQLQTLPTDPPLDDVETWLRAVEAGVESALERLGVASGVQLSAAEPRLRTAILPTTDKAYDVRRSVTSNVLTLMGAEGRIVRGRPLGSWVSRQHTWEPARLWWPDGMPALDPDLARARLVAAYLRAFGPATEQDLAWWTGWTLRVLRRTLTSLDTEATTAGLVLADDIDPVAPTAPAAAMLPALDATPMGWKDRTWFLPEDSRPFYDANGNIGPTVWWDGEVVGGWGVRKDGSIVTRLVVDRGREAARAVEAAAVRWGDRLEGTVVSPSFRTPLERALSGA